MAFQREGLIAAVDLGGTLTKMGLIAADGSVLAETSVPTDRSAGPDGTVSWLAATIAGLAAGHPVVGFGVIVPGTVDAAAGHVRAAVNLGWYDLPLRSRLETELGLPGAVAHDVRSAGLAEWRLGSQAGVSDLLFLPLGTGIAGAVVADGRLVDADGYAGEIGHVTVPSAGSIPCACGQSGCLETIASAAGVARTYARLATTPSPVTAEQVAELARSGEVPAVRAFELAVSALVEALTLYASLLGPKVIIIGGGLSGAADLILPAVAAGLADRLTFQRRPELVAASLGSRAGLIGAGLVGWDMIDTLSTDRPDRPSTTNGGTSR